MLRLNINGQAIALDVDSETPLLWVLRDHLNLTGTKYACGIGQCGACTVHIEGVPTRSCCIHLGSIGSKSIQTIEGVAKDHPIKEAWAANDVPQCGYCQTGQIMTAIALLERKPDPTEEEINRAMKGNICRCGTYPRIKKAIQSAAKKTLS